MYSLLPYKHNAFVIVGELYMQVIITKNIMFILGVFL